MSLAEQMRTAIESMRDRKDYYSRSLPEHQRWRHYGFVWGILWVADKLDYKDIVERARQIMQEIKDELGEGEG